MTGLPLKTHLTRRVVFLIYLFFDFLFTRGKRAEFRNFLSPYPAGRSRLLGNGWVRLIFTSKFVWASWWNPRNSRNKFILRNSVRFLSAGAFCFLSGFHRTILFYRTATAWLLLGIGPSEWGKLRDKCTFRSIENLYLLTFGICWKINVFVCGFLFSIVNGWVRTWVQGGSFLVSDGCHGIVCLSSTFSEVAFGSVTFRVALSLTYWRLVLCLWLWLHHPAG